VLMTAGVAAVTFCVLPPSFTPFDFGNDKHAKNWYVCMFCVLSLFDLRFAAI